MKIIKYEKIIKKENSKKIHRSLFTKVFRIWKIMIAYNLSRAIKPISNLNLLPIWITMAFGEVVIKKIPRKFHSHFISIRPF